MPFGINVKEVTAQVQQKFDLLIAKLDEILQELKAQHDTMKEVPK